MQGRAMLAPGRLRYRTVCGRPMVAPAKVVAVLLHRGCHLGCAAGQFFGGQRADGSDGRVQLFAGDRQHQLDAVLLVHAGGAGVVVHRRDVGVRVQGADLIDHALAPGREHHPRGLRPQRDPRQPGKPHQTDAGRGPREAGPARRGTACHRGTAGRRRTAGGDGGTINL